MIKPIKNFDGYFIPDNRLKDCIVYSPNKYRETEGIKDIGDNFWNEGRTAEISERFVHVDNKTMTI